MLVGVREPRSQVDLGAHLARHAADGDALHHASVRRGVPAEYQVFQDLLRVYESTQVTLNSEVTF